MDHNTIKYDAAVRSFTFPDVHFSRPFRAEEELLYHKCDLPYRTALMEQTHLGYDKSVLIPSVSAS